MLNRPTYSLQASLTTHFKCKRVVHFLQVPQYCPLPSIIKPIINWANVDKTWDMRHIIYDLMIQTFCAFREQEFPYVNSLPPGALNSYCIILSLLASTPYCTFFLSSAGVGKLFLLKGQINTQLLWAHFPVEFFSASDTFWMLMVLHQLSNSGPKSYNV